MKAMIFAAGMGTRLRPLTDSMPKALVPVAGKPMLQRVILRLKEAGFRDITVNIHHLGQQIIDYLHANGNFGVTIHISDERGALLDTGGGIRKARPFLDGDEPFLVHNVDTLSDVDLSALYRYHVEHGADATLLTSHRTTSRYLLTDADGRLCGWTNKSTGEVLPKELAPTDAGRYTEEAFNSIHVMSPSIFRYMDEWATCDRFSIIPFYVGVCRKALIRTHPVDGGVWFDIGKPETLHQAEAYYNR